MARHVIPTLLIKGSCCSKKWPAERRAGEGEGRGDQLRCFCRSGRGERKKEEMNLNPMKDAGSANGQGGGQGQGPTTTIPSLKRTLSGGAGGVHGGGPHGMGGHLGVGMNSIPSVLHANNPTAPPQMLRAVTSSGVFNRPVSSVGSLRGGSSLGGGPSSSLGGGPSSSVAGGATRSISQSSMQDWRMYLTIEERQAVRSKIRDAYTNRCSTYEDLLQVVRAAAVGGLGTERLMCVRVAGLRY